jgi:hypothetical protein
MSKHSGFWDYIHLGKSRTTNNGSDDDEDNQGHNLQQGLFQIATQTCNILVQVNNTNNINLGSDFNYKDFDANKYGESSRIATNKALFDLEQSVVLLQAKAGKAPSTPTKVRFSRLSEYKRRLSVSLTIFFLFYHGGEQIKPRIHLIAKIIRDHKVIVRPHN